MKGVLWGPALWNAMFACAWWSTQSDMPQLHKLVTYLVPQLLPCEKCRDHYSRKLAKVNRRAKGDPKTPDHVFRWLYYLKDEVNSTLKTPSIEFSDLTERYALHGGVVDDVLLGDALVLVALNANDLQRDDLFLEMCESLAILLPLPTDSQFIKNLQLMNRPIIPAAVRAAKAARVERGLRAFPLAHYRAASE